MSEFACATRYINTECSMNTEKEKIISNLSIPDLKVELPYIIIMHLDVFVNFRRELNCNVPTYIIYIFCVLNVNHSKIIIYYIL